MRTMLSECNSGDLKTDPKTFEQTWCNRCSMPDCTLARFAREDLLAERNRTWRQRYFGQASADLKIPKFAQIHALDFPDLLEKAIKIEISERRGDWSVPTTLTPLVSPSPIKADVEPEEPAQEEEEEDPVEEPIGPAPAPFAAVPVMATPRKGNVPDQEILVGGGPLPTPTPTPATDPWAAPSRPARVVVAPGARIQLGKKP